jgi:hypothetical protein
MKTTSILIAFVLVTKTAAFADQNAGSAPPPSFVFVGKVQGMTTMAGDNSAAVAIVRVEQPVRTAGTLTIEPNTIVHVKLEDGAAVKEGDRKLFKTDAMSYADVITLRGIAEPPPPAALLGGPQGTDQELARHVADADLVISGVVTAVRPMSQRRRAALANVSPRRPISEHDPKWKEATVSIASVLKGDTSVENVTILFPSSRDTLWAESPRFRADSRGVFILHKNQIEDENIRAVLLAPAAIARRGVNGGTFTALDHVDVLPETAAEAIKRMVAH